MATLLAALFAVVSLTACHAKPKEDPSATYQRAYDEFLHGNLDIARGLADEARQRWFAAASPRHAEWSLRFRLLQAEILIYQGRSRDVVQLLKAPEAGYSDVGPMAIKRNILNALAHRGLGERTVSDQELREAHRLAELGDSPLMGEVLRTEGQFQVAQNHLPEATSLFKKSLASAREHKDSYLAATDLLNIGYVSMEMGHYDEALAQFTDAADFAKTIQARTVIEAALGNTGEAFLHLGDFEKALVDFQLAEAQAKQIGTTSAQVSWLRDAGFAYYKLGNVAKAKDADLQALAAASASKVVDSMVDLDTNLALIFYREGQFEVAEQYAEKASREAVAAVDSTAVGYPLFIQGLLAKSTPLLLQAHEQAATHPALQWDIENAIANAYREQHDTRRAEQWYQKSLRTFETQRASVEDDALKLSFFANADSLYQDYADFLIDSHRSNEALQLLDSSRARTLADGLGLTASSIKSSQFKTTDAQALAGRLHASILFYALGNDKSYLWAIDSRRTQLFVLAGRARIEGLIQNYQSTILKSSDPLRDDSAAAQTLYDLLIAPAAPMIPKDANVVVIADGALNALNFETLIMPSDHGTQYWIERVTLQNASSLRLLSGREALKTALPARNMLLIGNPVAANDEYGVLPNAGDEVSEIEKHFAAADRHVVTQAAAIPAAYASSHPEQFAYIHFVAHGTASRLSPLDSAVVLSAPAGDPDGLKLYARDIVSLPLHADLVTISACYSSGLRAYAGEGLTGLAWAFLRAGSHHVIGALWEASDASTPLLMDRLYGELEAGKAPAVALRNAKLELVHSQGVFRKPLYWGAFQLYEGS